MSLDSLAPLIQLITEKNLNDNDQSMFLTMREWTLVVAALTFAAGNNLDSNQFLPQLKPGDLFDPRQMRDEFNGIAYLVRRTLEGAAREARDQS